MHEGQPGAAPRRALVVSDSHGRLDMLHRAIMEARPFDLLIHLGDIHHGAERIRDMAPSQVEMVAGNMDAGSSLPRSSLVALGRHTAWLTHGDLYAVHHGIRELVREAKSRNAGMVLYGHTHCPSAVLFDSVVALCPGSIAEPRQPGGKPGYAILDMDGRGEMAISLRDVGAEAPHTVLTVPALPLRTAQN